MVSYVDLVVQPLGGSVVTVTQPVLQAMEPMISMTTAATVVAPVTVAPLVTMTLTTTM